MTNLYFIALLTPEDIEAKIIAIQQNVSAKFQSRHALKSPPHITLVLPFKYDRVSEKDITEPLINFFLHFSPFAVQLDGFNCFERNRVVFINVTQNETLKKLYDALIEFVKNNLPIVLQRQHEQFTPHLTIASRDLRKEMFHLAWNEFKEKTFSESWVADSAFLLRHKGKEWIPVKEFKFYGK
ncbi:MAG: 2'-5' RNA ligase family protein [Bacteroidia bacterium]|nr:2'-5' RNA ligase family protein [Bacteroidia bacterium]